MTIPPGRSAKPPRKPIRSKMGRPINCAGLAYNKRGAQSDYPREQLQGYVLGNTAEEIAAKVGQPAEVDETNPDKPILIF